MAKIEERPPAAQPGTEPTTFKFVSESGATMMEVEGIGREGDKLRMHGKMMGEFPQDVYLTPGQFLAMVRMGLRPGPVLFLLRAPASGVSRLLGAAKAEPQERTPLLLLAFLAALLLLLPAFLATLALAVVITPVTLLALATASAIVGFRRSRSS